MMYSKSRWESGVDLVAELEEDITMTTKGFAEASMCLFALILTTMSIGTVCTSHRKLIVVLLTYFFRRHCRYSTAPQHEYVVGFILNGV